MLLLLFLRKPFLTYFAKDLCLVCGCVQKFTQDADRYKFSDKDSQHHIRIGIGHFVSYAQNPRYYQDV